MAIALDKFLGLLQESGLIPREELAALLAEIPAPRQADAEQLARELVKRKKLTAYQAQEVYAGRGKKLVLGNYVIQDKLGQGGMGMVLKAEHRRMERIVALKVMSKAAVESPEAVKRFHREVKAAAKLTHPNIVTAFDADEAAGTHFFVMEFVEGTDLSQLVKKNGPMAVEKAVTCILHAARGLEFAHEHGIVHRDIKPANLLLDPRGNVKILDMGLARIESIGGEQAELTGTGQIMGTVDYMAPEQAVNTRKADHRADIYALGISLWYLLTGKVAYGGETVIEKLMAHQSAPIPSLTELRQDVSPTLEAVFRKMVAKTPPERYQSMTEVIAALERSRGKAGDISPTVTLGPSEDAKLSAFLQGGPAASSHASGGAPVVAVAPSSVAGSTGAELEQTIVTAGPQADTDPQTQTSLHAPPVPPPAPFTFSALEKAAEKPAPPESGLHGPIWTRPLTLMIAGGTVGGLVLLLAIWSVWHSFSGDGVPKITIPPGGSATIVPADSPVSPKSPGTEAARYALGFDGKQTRAQTSAPPEVITKEITVEAWVVPTAAGTYAAFDKLPTGHIYRNQKTTNGALSLQYTQVTGGSYQWKFATFSEQAKLFSISSTDRCELGKLAHVAGVFDGKELTLYVNGRKQGAGVSMRDSSPIAALPLTLGGSEQGVGSFVGQIRQVRISKIPRYKLDFTPEPVLASDAATLALFRCDEGTGDVLHDLSDLKRDAKITAPSWVSLTAPAPSGGNSLALRFDGVDDYVELPPWPNLPLGTTLTIEAWATLEQPLEKRGGRSVFQMGPLRSGAGMGPNGKVAWLSALVGDMKLELMPSGLPARPRERTHVAIAHNDRGLVYYLNGKEHVRRSYAQLNVPPKLIWEQMLKRPMLVGGGQNPDGTRTNFWPGTIDELRISKSKRYEGNFTPKDRFELDADTLALYRFEEGQGVVLKDSSPNRRDGKIIGASWVLPNSSPPAIEPEEPSPPAALPRPEPAVLPFAAAQAVAHQRAWAKYLGGEVASPNSVGMKMIVIPPGRFTMGRSPRDAEILQGEKLPDDDLPRHSVTLTRPFAIAATEVTQKQWKDVMGTTPWVGMKQVGESDDCPATYVSWKDAREFCKRLSEKEQVEYRLPTEAEWEWACRAGTETTFNFGDDYKELYDHAWARFNSQDRPHPVAQRNPNEWGLFDMHGNAWEWSEDVYGPYSAEAAVDPRSQGTGNKRTLRGGCFWSVPTSDYRSSARRAWPETLAYSESGFRPVRTLEPPIKAAALPSEVGESHFALEFDGVDDLVMLPEIAYDRTSPITFEAWVTPRITEKDVTEDTNRGVWANAGWLMQVSAWGWSHWRNGSDPLQTGIVKGKRVHLAAQWDGTEASLFVDGKRVKANGKNDGRGSDLPRHLGCVGDLYGNNHRGYFPGIIDEVRISKIARYTADFQPPERHAADGNTLALYHCDEGEGEELRDSSSNNRHARLVGNRGAPGPKWVEVAPLRP